MQEITKEAERINRSLGNNRVNFDVDKARDHLNKIWELANKLESSIGKTHKITAGTASFPADRHCGTHGLILRNKNAVQYSQECKHRKPGRSRVVYVGIEINQEILTTSRPWRNRPVVRMSNDVDTYSLASRSDHEQ